MRVILLLVVLVIASTAEAQVQERLEDLRLATAVRLALVADPMTRPIDVDVVARRGIVELASEEGRRARDLVRVARTVPGVRSVSGLGIETDAPMGPTVTVSDPPARDEVPPESGPVYHTVQRGDTLFGLARRYDTTLDAILTLNNRQSTAIRVGERIRVR
ncbi:MAG: LysM peptidoglycan-binding domain-containing protein [Bacteroidota bacterium]